MNECCGLVQAEIQRISRSDRSDRDKAYAEAGDG
ncbi:hypothetical protein EZS27_014896 [termite gut metagenome]|uniref:Uncharacterized protein n=1 Tax=termite gut metagenome TaxID=433724 RepID=A0A5J4RTP6_9ZZZZ